MCCFALTLPLALVFADEAETEIPLYEICSSEPFIIGDEPLDSPGQGSNNPPRPNDFRATVSGRTLSVTSANSSLSHIVVRNAASTTVVSTQFTGMTVQQLPAAGNYTLEIYSGGTALAGFFTAQ